MFGKAFLWSLLAVACLAGCFFAYKHIVRGGHNDSLFARMGQIVAVGNQPQVPCVEVLASQPLVLLALGQSNAGNHGTASVQTAEAITMVAEGKCIKATDPLPGGTGTGGSIWQRLPALMSMQKNARPIVLSVLAVDASTIGEWTRSDSPLKERLESQVDSMRHLGFSPDLILWQQGEADARSGTSAEDYAKGLGRLATLFNDLGLKVPIVLARSSICRTAPSAAIRSAVDSVVSGDSRFRLGPDTDTLSSSAFRDGCHLTAEGLDLAAKMWAISISQNAWPVEQR